MNDETLFAMALQKGWGLFCGEIAYLDVIT